MCDSGCVLEGRVPSVLMMHASSCDATNRVVKKRVLRTNGQSLSQQDCERVSIISKVEREGIAHLPNSSPSSRQANANDP